MPRSSPEEFLHRHHRWLRTVWPLGILTIGLAATLAFGLWRHPVWARVETWDRLDAWFLGGGVLLTLLAAAAGWLWQRRELLDSAQSLDDRLDARNRLETTASLRDDPGALARAQREETAAFLERSPVRPRSRDLRPLAALLGLLAVAYLGTFLSWTRPWAHPVEVAAAARPRPTPPADMPDAAIKWKSPEPETKAAPIEEVPLTAVATSTSGLRNLSLEVEVNGEPRPPVLIPAEDLKKAGAHPVETSLYLDQLEVQPYDVISYHLRAQRVDSRKLPETVSPVQFVQVKPFRDDVQEVPGGGESQAQFALIVALKAAQLRLIKENFTLAHAEIGHDNPDWKTENRRVGGEQNTLEKKMGEAIEKLTADGLPAEIIDLLAQSRPLMADAGRKIDAALNQPAILPQGKALGLITQVEKFFVKQMAKAGGSVHGKALNVDDPFKDQKELTLKQRFATMAGELELLAREQAKVANDLADPPPPAPAAAAIPAGTPDPNKIEGTLAERQTQIAQRLGAMLNGKTFLPEITQHLEKGHEDARTSLSRIDAADQPAAREPAASAARELQMAIEAMNKQGEDQAKEELTAAAKILNQAADEARSAPQQRSPEEARQKADEAGQKAAEAARKLADAAREQQETGSQKAAQRLAELSKAVSAQETRKALAEMRQRPRDAAKAQEAGDRLQRLAELTTHQDQNGTFSPERIAQLADRLERDRANLNRMALNQPAVPPTTGMPRQEAGQSSPSGLQPGVQPGQPGIPKMGGQGKTGEQGSKPEEKGQQGTAPGKGQTGGPSGAPSTSGGQGISPSGSQSASGGGGAPAANHPGQATRQTPEDTVQRALSPLSTSNETREKFTRELVDDLRDAVMDTESFAPGAEDAARVKEAMHFDPGQPPPELRTLLARVNPPLEGLIKVLRAELEGAQRKYQLTDESAEQAPAAYQAAVAEYFEELSRDYKAASTPAPKEPAAK